MAYKSGFEKAVAKSFKQNGISYEYETEVVHFVQPEKKRKYTPDFKIRTKKAGVLFVETKGKFTKEDRDKLIWVRDQNPKLRLVLLFMNSSNKLRKNSKTTYADWCKKNEFEYYDFREGLPETWK